MPFPFSHSRSPRPLSWKDALHRVPLWRLEQPAAPSPAFPGTGAQLSVVSGLGDSSLNPRGDKNPVLPREQPECLPARAGEFARRRNIGKPIPARKATFHSCLYFPARLFFFPFSFS